MVKSYEKFDSVSSVNNFVNKGKFQQKSGVFKLGTDTDINHSETIGNGNIIFNVGSAYTQGNQVRSFFDTNDNGPFLYSYVEKDKENIQTQYSNIFIQYPNLKDFPYLYPSSSLWKSNKTIIDSKNFPLYRYSGKGLGKIEFYNAGSITSGNIQEGQPLYLEHYSGVNVAGSIPSLSAPRNINGLTFPSSGLIYSGTLLQYSFEKNDNTQSYKNVKVTPYQAGRGIPQWDPTKEYFGGQPFGPPLWEGTTLTIEPQLSPGVGTSNNDFCIGVSLDTQASAEKPVIYKYSYPEGYDKDEQQQHEPWYNHPAPFTAPPEDISFTKTPRIYSPGPNSAGNYWAPWPHYYAYQPEDPVPVLTTGKTTLKIGAACNIGMQAYYEPDVVQGDNPINNPNYVSVSCVPLFQGEKVKVGSEIFASAMGQVITWDRRGVSPYPPGSFINVTGNKFEGPGFQPDLVFGAFRETREENPWYDYSDSTFGTIGWTSTPGFLLSNIPDKGSSIVQTKVNIPLPFMVQSNQGSVIVQGSTITNPLDEGGSGRMELLGPAEYNKSTPSTNCHTLNFEKIKKYPQQPGRSQPIGHTMQEIEGTGRWSYTGELDLNEQTINVGGFGYSVGFYYVSGGTGQNCIVEVTSVDTMGSITGVSLSFEGTGYTDGDLLTVVGNNVVPFADGSVQFSKNSALLVWNAAGPSVSLWYNGTKYKSATQIQSFNLTKNNLVMEITTTMTGSAGGLKSLYGGLIDSYSVHSVTDPSQYPVGTLFYAMNTLSSEKYTKSGPLAIFEVLTNDGVTITVQFYKAFYGDCFTYPTGTYLYTTQKLNHVAPTLTINATNGAVTRIGVTDVGVGNDNGDLVMITQEGSDQNCIFQLNLNLQQRPLGARLIEGGSNYVFEQLYSLKYVSFNNKVKILNPGGTYSGIEMQMNDVNENGTIKKISYNFSEFITFNPQFSTYTGTFGNIQTIEQTFVPSIATQPVAGAEPVGGWPSFVTIKNATFEQGIDTFIALGGSGYSTGGPFSVTGGSGTGMTVAITEVDTNGAIKNIKVIDVGKNYLYDDSINVVSGNNDSDIILKIPATQSVGVSVPTSGGFGSISAALYYFDLKVLEKGSGYSVGGPYPTIINNRDGTQMFINVLKVDSNGGVLDLEIAIPGFAYTLKNNIIIDSGNQDCLFQLTNARKIQPIKFTKQGTQYTTATGVSTYNLTSNSLYTICGLGTSGVGECEAIDYNAGDLKPPGWNLSRYNVGDIIAFNQNGNITSTAQINTIDALTQTITFTQISFGTGYNPPTTPYAFLPTINVSQTSTTVDIVADDNGQIVEVSINTLGSDVQAGDFLVIEQGDNNAVIQVCPVRDVPPQWQNACNGSNPTAKQWNDYKEVMKSSVNLLDYPLLSDFFHGYPNYMNTSYYTYGDEGITGDLNVGYYYA